MKEKKSIFGTSGIRRIADKELVELALDVGISLGYIHKEVIVGGDTRKSSSALRKAVITGLEAAGAHAHDAGMVPTPTLAIAAKDFEAAVMITASHNPPQYNGLKLINPDGSAFDKSQKTQIEDMLENGTSDCIEWNKFGRSSTYEGAVLQHIDRINEYFKEDLRGIRVVIDCGGGAGSVITPLVLEKLGCEVIAINSQSDGIFPRGIEPVEKNLEELKDAVRKHRAALGIAHDGDADRTMAVDDKGQFISGDKLLIMLANHIGARNIVTTLDASMAVEEAGFSVTRTSVGDNYVSEKLKRKGDFGGEPSGSWVFPYNTLCPDGILTAAYLAMMATKHKLSKTVGALPSYPIIRDSIDIDKTKAIKDMSNKIKELMPESIENTDGYKATFKDGWLLIRPSGTEPKIRITAEGKTPELAESIYHQGLNVIRESIYDEGKE